MKTQSFGRSSSTYTNYLRKSYHGLPLSHSPILLQEAQRNYIENRENGTNLDNPQRPFPSGGLDTLSIESSTWQGFMGWGKWPDSNERYWWRIALSDGRNINDFYWIKDENRTYHEQNNEDRYSFIVHHVPTGTKMEGFSQEPDHEKGFPDQYGNYWYYIKYTECGYIKAWMEEKDNNYLARLQREKKQHSILSLSFSSNSSTLLTMQIDQADTNFHRAIKNSDHDLLVTYCASTPELIDKMNSNGETALHLAVMLDEIELATVLTLHGAEIGIKNKAGKSPHGMLLNKKESYFSTIEKKRLLALMMTLKHFDLKSLNFGADLANDIRKLTAELIQMNRPFVRGAASVISKHILPSKLKLHHTFDKKSHSKSFLEMGKVSLLSPLLDITAFAVQGLHERASLLVDKKEKKLKIILGSYKGDVKDATLGGVDNAYGVYYHDNAIYLGGKRDKDTERSKMFVRGTLVHEITHFVAHEVFNNDAKPYKKDDQEAINIFSRICDRIEAEVKKDKKSFHERIYSVFSYDKRNWHSELIVRVPQLIAMGLFKEIEQFCPDLLQYYSEYFLKACQMHLLKLHHRNGVFLPLIYQKQQEKISLKGKLSHLILFENAEDLDVSDEDESAFREEGKESIDFKLASFDYELCRAVVQVEFIAQKPQDLSVNKGQEVSVLERGERWWVCELNGRQGRVPSACFGALSSRVFSSLRDPLIFDQTLNEPFSEQKQVQKAKKYSENELPLHEFAQRTVIEGINQDRLAHGIQESKRGLKKQDEKKEITENKEIFEFSSSSVFSCPETNSTFFASTQSEAVYFKPDPTFVVYFCQRKDEGYKFSVKQEVNVLEMTCVAAKLRDPLFDIHLDQLRRFLKKHLQDAGKGKLVILTKDDVTLTAYGDPSVIAGLGQLLKTVAASNSTEQNFNCVIS
jgi:hypothetical protein